MKQEIADFEMQKEAMRKAIEAYKASEECCQGKLAFSELSFAEGMDDTRKRIAKCYPFLKLDFLDEEDSADDAPIEDVPALEVGVVGTEGAIDASYT